MSKHRKTFLVNVLLCCLLVNSCGTGLIMDTTTDSSTESPLTPRAPGVSSLGSMENVQGAGFAQGEEHYLTSHKIGSSFKHNYMKSSNEMYESRSQ